MPILFAVSPFAAIRSAPVTTQSTSPAAISDAAAESAITACGMPAVSSSHAVSRAPLQQRPRLVDPNVLEQAALARGDQRADRAAVAAGRETAGVAVRERTRAGVEERRRVRRHRAAALDLVAVELSRGLVRRLGVHLVERPAEVDGGRPRPPQDVVGGLADPPRARRRARSRRRPRCRSPAHRERPSSLIAAATSAAVRQTTSTSSRGQSTLVEEDDGVVPRA